MAVIIAKANHKSSYKSAKTLILVLIQTIYNLKSDKVLHK
jgi:hypothetical protein